MASKLCYKCKGTGFAPVHTSSIFVEWTVYLDGRERTVKIYKLCECQERILANVDDSDLSCVQGD